MTTEHDIKNIKNNWLVYIIHCDDESLYTGITTDMSRRWEQHSNSTGAKYFRGRSPKYLVYLEASDDRSKASQREAQIKKLSKKKKHSLVNSEENQLEIIELPGWEFIE